MSDVVTREIKIAAPPEEVFPYFIEHDKIVRWKGQAIEHEHATGWEHYLARLAIAADGDGPGRDPWLDGAP